MCHILIIEDEPIVAMLIRDILELEGATSFDTAATEEEALTLALETRPALITSDVRLRVGTGPRAVERIHGALGEEVPVIFITGTPDECSPCAPPGCVLTKPIDIARMTAAFHRMSAA